VLGVGCEIRILGRKRPGRIKSSPLKDEYGIREAGLKSTKPVIQTFNSVNNFGVDENIQSRGECVAEAEISIKQGLTNIPVVYVITSKNGEFGFDISDIPDFPAQGTFIFEITPSKEFAKSKNILTVTEKIKVNFITPESGKFSFILFWESPTRSKGILKGGFAVSGRSGT
jgi:hypothetical protein